MTDLSFKRLVFESSYTPIALSEDDRDAVDEIRFGEGVVDFYCTRCKSNSTFVRKLTDNQKHEKNIALAQPVSGQFVKAAHRHLTDTLRNGEISVEFCCSRNSSHTALFVFLIQDRNLIKLGQYPSLADITHPELDQYKNILGEEPLRELKKAAGLAAHGVGIGSMVYLRRIFEGILRKHYEDMKTQGTAIPDFATMRMDEKIDALRGTLPPFLVQNKTLYGILSKGVHELAEEECLKFFPLILQSTLMILQQDEEARKRRIAEQKAAAELQKLASELRARFKSLAKEAAFGWGERGGGA